MFVFDVPVLCLHEAVLMYGQVRNTDREAVHDY